MADIFNIIIAGVGGQGVVRLGNILREYGMKIPLIMNVVGTETRGVSQREGSVMATARFLIKDQVYSLNQGYEVEDLISPLVPINDADLVLGLEPLETIRNIKYYSKQTTIILNTHKHYPRNVILGAEKGKKYPTIDQIREDLEEFSKKIIFYDFNELSEEKFRSSIFSNTIILGTSVKQTQEIFDKNIILELIQENFREPEKNTEAFELGYNLQ